MSAAGQATVAVAEPPPIGRDARSPPSPRSVRRGVFGAVLMFLGLALLSGLAVRPFRSADESAHVAYAIEVGHGTIPRVGERPTTLLPGQAPLNTAVNHPPLYYALLSGPLLLGVDTGHALGGLYLARVESALFSAATVALTAVFAWLLLGRRRPEAAIAAAGVMATIGGFVFTSSLVYNDSLATLLCLAVLTAALAVLRDGLRVGRCVPLILAAAAAVATRASNVEVVAVACVALVGAGAIHHRDRWRGLAHGVGWSTAVGAGCFAAAGWFYLLNQSRYGHLTGRTRDAGEAPSSLWAAFHDHAPGSSGAFLFSPRTYARIARQSYGDLLHVSNTLAWFDSTALVGLVAIWSLVGIGLLWWLLGRPRLRPARTAQALAGIVVLHCMACLIYVAWWVHQGGFPIFRYFFPALPVLAVAIARVLTGLPGGRKLACLVLAWQLALSLCYLARLPAQWTGADIWHAYPDALGRAGVPAPALTTAALLAVVVCGWLLCAGAVLTATEKRNSAKHRG